MPVVCQSAIRDGLGRDSQDSLLFPSVTVVSQPAVLDGLGEIPKIDSQDSLLFLCMPVVSQSAVLDGLGRDSEDRAGRDGRGPQHPVRFRPG